MSRSTRLVLAAIIAASIALTGCTASPSADPVPSATTPSGSVSLADLLQLGIQSAQAGDIDEAAATFQNILAVDPGNAVANYNLGVLAQQSGNTAEALTYYDAAIASDPAFTSAMYNKAILVEESDPAAALAIYSTIVEINDQAATAYFRMSLLLEREGDEAGATEARENALAIDPTLAGAESGE